MNVSKQIYFAASAVTLTAFCLAGAVILVKRSNRAVEAPSLSVNTSSREVAFAQSETGPALIRSEKEQTTASEPDYETRVVVTLQEVIAAVCEDANIPFRSVARRRIVPNRPWQTKSRPEEVITEIAQAASLPVISDGAYVTLSGGQSVVLSDVAVYVGSDDSVVDLLEDMGNKDPDIRSEAVETLGDYRKPSFEPVFAHVLTKDPADEARISASVSLENAKKEESVDALIEALETESIEVRENVLVTLETISRPDLRDKLMRARDRISDPQVIEAVEQILEDVFDEPLFLDIDEPVRGGKRDS